MAGRKEDAKGRVKEATGSLTKRGDLKRKGADDQSKGKAKRTASEAKGKAQEKAKEAKGKAGRAADRVRGRK